MVALASQARLCSPDSYPRPIIPRADHEVIFHAQLIAGIASLWRGGDPAYEAQFGQLVCRRRVCMELLKKTSCISESFGECKGGLFFTTSRGLPWIWQLIEGRR